MLLSFKPGILSLKKNYYLSSVLEQIPIFPSDLLFPKMYQTVKTNRRIAETVNTKEMIIPTLLIAPSSERSITKNHQFVTKRINASN